MERICHITDAHPPEDGRIFRRACVSCVRAGYETYLVERGETYDKMGVHIVGIGQPEKASRLYRMTLFAKKAYETALRIDADIYHLHDPELLPYALKFKKLGKKVVFDSHEDYVEQIRQKTYLPKPIAHVVSRLFQYYSNRVYKRIDGLTYPGSGMVNSAFDGSCRNVVQTDNLPWLSELYDKYSANANKEPNTVCYIGGLDEARGITQIVRAAELANCKLYLAGPFSSDDYRRTIEMTDKHSHVEYLGVLDRNQIVELLQKVEIGLCTLLDVGQYYKMKNLPTKVYEYMSMGLPVVINDSAYNKYFIEQCRIGYAVDSSSPEEIAHAITALLEDKALREECGKNGRNAIINTYCWDKVQNNLLDMYQSILHSEN